MKLGILLSGFEKFSKHYVSSCEEIGVDYELIDFSSSDWMELIQKSDCDGFLCRPPCEFTETKTMYDERLYILNKLMGKPIYPSFDECYIYENKRMMSYWLKLNNFPHAKTNVFYKKNKFLDFLNKNTDYPLVFKQNIGATSFGVDIVQSKRKAVTIANKVFGWLQLRNNLGYHLAKGYYKFKKVKKLPFPSYGTAQKHYLIVQEFEKIKWEWRIIKIGESYFGHQKLLEGDFASGSNKVGWIKPPEELLYMVKDICEKGKFYSMACDIFETEDGRFLVNEIQSLFGSYLDSQMYIDGVPGRYLYQDDKFVFEEGVFNRHGSYLLRVEHFMKILRNV